MRGIFTFMAMAMKMNSKKYTAFLLLFALLHILGTGLQAQVYVVKKIPGGSLHVNGQSIERIWKKANLLTSFSYPWDSAQAPATRFTALHDNHWLYCLYVVADDSVNVYSITNEKIEIGASDRVEIFFKQNDQMSPYYCLELDAAGRILDYSAAYYRQMDYTWQWPKDQLSVKASRTKNGYLVETAISLTSLKELGLLTGNRLQVGLFRAECTGIKDGKADLKWISWINPRVAVPDFHIPAAFGTFLLK